MKLVRVLILQMFVQLILRRESFGAAGRCAREESPFSVSLNMSFELSFVVEERRTQSASVFASWSNLRLDRDSVRAEMVIQLRHRVVFLWTLATDILLDLVVSLHVVVEIGNLCKRTTAVVFDAYERTFSCMETTMIVEVCNLRECLAAIDAKKDERSLKGNFQGKIVD